MSRDKIIDTVVALEDVLLKTDLNWSISYNPSTKSFSVFIAEEEDKDE